MTRSTTKQQSKADNIAEYPGAENETLVVLTLAHPLPDRDKAYLGLAADSDLSVGKTIAVSKNAAKSLINAGMVTVDPENRPQVKAALNGEAPEKVAELGSATSETDTEPAATSGN